MEGVCTIDGVTKKSYFVLIRIIETIYLLLNDVLVRVDISKLFLILYIIDYILSHWYILYVLFLAYSKFYILILIVLIFQFFTYPGEEHS